MNIYTKNGDQGYTSLMNQRRIAKTDDRIELLGVIDELNSHIGLAKVQADATLKENLSQVQKTLMKIMAGVADCSKREFKLAADEVTKLENQIDVMENAFSREKKFVLYGECEVSARLDLARAVARRAERQFYRVAKVYGADTQALKYMNRLSDYLYMCARFAGATKEEREEEQMLEDVIKRVIKHLKE